LIGHSLEIVCPLEHGNVPCEVFLVDAPERPKEVAQSRPSILHGVAMHLTDAFPVIVPGVFPLGLLAYSLRGVHPFTDMSGDVSFGSWDFV